MDKIKLLPHNQEMVEQIEKAMVDGYRKIFYTQATGLGKSFIFMYLVNKYFKDKKVLYICPKNHIWYNMQSYKEFDLIKKCVTYICNADFNKIKPRHLYFDVIFIDEAHHLTAPVQGENILKLVELTLKNNPNAYAFGFTATPYVNNELIGDKYFDTSIIGLNLFEAIDDGLLQKINYAIAIKEDINFTDEEKSLVIKYNVETTSNMVTDIVNQYSNVKHWLAYFPFIDELEENIEYFKQYFPDYKLFVIHSEIENSEIILREFEKYEGKAILASVSMVLEGIHPKSVEGILLYRNVCTINTFFQIIGRLGIMKPNCNPICIDIYNSYNHIISSNNIVSEIESDINNISKKSIKDYIYMSPNTYKFIELSNIIYNLRNNHINEYRDIIWTTNQDLSKRLGRGISYVSERIRAGKTYQELIDEYLDGKPMMTYRGISWFDNADLSRKLGKNDAYVNSRIHNSGKSYEEIIDYCLDGKPIMTYRGITWTTNVDLSRKLGKNDTYVTDRIKKGKKTYEEIIDYCLDTPVDTRTYRGITWKSNADLSKKLGKLYNYVSERIRAGKTYQELIDEYLDGKPMMTYRGISWFDNADLSRKLGKNKGYVGQSISRGKTYEEIIDYCLDSKPIMTYRGITWTTDSELSRKLGKNDAYTHMCRFNGKTYEEIIDYCLNTPVKDPRTYRGITWTSDADLSRKLGKYTSYVSEHHRRGKSYEEIIDYCLDK